MKLQKELSETITANTADIPAVPKQIEKVESRRYELNKIRYVMLYRMQRVLLPEQYKKLLAYFERREAERRARVEAEAEARRLRLEAEAKSDAEKAEKRRIEAERAAEYAKRQAEEDERRAKIQAELDEQRRIKEEAERERRLKIQAELDARRAREQAEYKVKVELELRANVEAQARITAGVRTTRTLLVAYLALFPALFTLCLGWLGSIFGTRAILLAPAIWVTTELGRTLMEQVRAGAASAKRNARRFTKRVECFVCCRPEPCKLRILSAWPMCCHWKTCTRGSPPLRRRRRCPRRAAPRVWLCGWTAPQGDGSQRGLTPP